MAKPQEAAYEQEAVEVTYKPLNPTDPNVVPWNGIKFQANVPVMLDPRKHYIVVDTVTKTQTINGIVGTVTSPTRVSMIELAKGNPDFEVRGHPRAVRIKPSGRVPPAGAEWNGTNRDELISDVPWPTDFDPRAGALVIS